MLTALLLLAAAAAADDEPPDWRERLDLSGDLRLRAEHDWSSLRMDGSERDDRPRFRYRFRVMATWTLSEAFTVRARLRTGVPDNAQSPHYNFGYIGVASVPLQLDRVSLTGRWGAHWLRLGKDAFPFWKQNELFWDDDVQPEGAAASAAIGERVSARLTAGAFMLAHDHDYAVPNSGLFAGQLTLQANPGPVSFTAASGLYGFVNMVNVPEWDLLYEGERHRQDYLILVSGLRAQGEARGLPWALGLDHMWNLADYSALGWMEDAYKDQKTGLVATAQLGSTRERGDWLVAYTWAYKEKYAVVDYLCEDDWVRWGNIHRNRTSNYAGHEARVAVGLGPRADLMLRVYSVRGLVTTDTTLETGRRARLDLNVRF